MKDKLLELYERFFIHDGWKKAEFYKKHQWFHSQGEGCYIPVHISKRESYLISLGNNVWLTHGTSLINHDASVQVVKKAKGIDWLDKIEKIVIGDNVYVGNNAMILPGVTIGSNCIVGGGTVVTKDIPSNSVVAGNPGRFIRTFDEYADKCKSITEKYPWDKETPASELRKIREDYFWGKTSQETEETNS